MSFEPPGLRRFALADIPPEPWRNGGGGFTRTLAVGADTTADPWLWRVSLATIERDGPFSCFPGMDRISMLIEGAELALEEASGSTLLRLGLNQTGAYPGEAELFARVKGAPLQCLNVMTTRGRCQAHVSTVAQSAAPQHACLLVVLKGSFSYTSGVDNFKQNMPVAHGLHTNLAINLIVTATEPNSLLALIEIYPVAPESANARDR